MISKHVPTATILALYVFPSHFAPASFLILIFLETAVLDATMLCCPVPFHRTCMHSEYALFPVAKSLAIIPYSTFLQGKFWGITTVKKFVGKILANAKIF